ncbi:MAG: DUF547 domain-containing protein, partial [Phycisphaerae bacterium]|nr:DUF547 domain-containing protein [Phycisphaerae bacterium]
MAKNRVVFIMLLTVLVFIVGCSPTEGEPPNSPEAEPPKYELVKAEPNLFESNQVELNETELVKTEPNDEIVTEEVKPKKAEPNEAEPTVIEPNEAESTKAEPNEPETARTEPNEGEIIKVEPNDVKPTHKVNFHDKFADILREFVDDKGMVDYRRLKLKRGKLRMLLGEFTKLNRNEYNSWPKEDKIAFWINAYNVQMLHIIIDNYPIESYRWLHLLTGWEPDSIRHIDKRIGGIKKQKFYVMDEVFTLPQVEKLFFGQGFDEPRAFFALFYATLSSPPLRNEPYYGHKLYKQMDEQAKKFISSQLGFKIDRKKRRVYLSAILQPAWFGSGFISKYGTNKKFKEQEPAVRAVLSFITNYISEQDKHFLEVENYSIEYITPNWRLNDNS